LLTEEALLGVFFDVKSSFDGVTGSRDPGARTYRSSDRRGSGAGKRTPPPPASTTGIMSGLLGKVFEVGEAIRVVDAAIRVSRCAASLRRGAEATSAGTWPSLSGGSLPSSSDGGTTCVCQPGGGAWREKGQTALAVRTISGSRLRRRSGSPRENRASAVGQPTVGGTDSALD